MLRLLQGDGEMDEVEIEVVKAQISKGAFAGGTHVLLPHKPPGGFTWACNPSRARSRTREW
jgi:hypothetical protein